MRDTGMTERARLRVSAVGTMVQVKQLADSSATAGTMVQEKVLVSTLDNLWAVQERLLERTAGSCLAAQAMPLVSNAHSL